MIATLLSLIALAQPPPVPDGPPPVPGVRIARASVPRRCPCPHCPPGCDGKACRYYSGPPCCGECTCPAWGVEKPKPPVAPLGWQRTDSRGIAWTHADRAYLDAYVDAVERSYAAPPAPAATTYTLVPATTPTLYYYYAAPTTGVLYYTAAPTVATVTCAGGQCTITAGR